MDPIEAPENVRALKASAEVLAARLAHWGPAPDGMSCDALGTHLISLATRIGTQMATGAIVRSSAAELAALCVFLMEATDG